MTKHYIQQYNYWLNHLSTLERKLVLDMDINEMEDAFSYHLEFGTAGVRAKIGMGPNRMNVYVVRRIISAYAKWLSANGKKSIVTTHDNRMFGVLFVQEVSNIMFQYGIETYSFADMRPAPMISYFIRSMNFDGGINFTASHNPRDYLGIKLVNDEGSQLVPTDIDDIGLLLSDEDMFASYEHHIYKIITMEDELDYDRMIHNLVTEDLSQLSVVYSPLHGAGGTVVPRIFPFVHLVEEQMDPSPYFPTIDLPNPEFIEAYRLSEELAKLLKASLIILNDPDADRFGVMILHDNSYHFIDGNKLGAILLDYLIKSRHPKNSVVYKTIATSRLGLKICEAHDISIIETNVGFKWIGQAIKENKLNKNFLFAYEESHGCIIDDCVRDKDGIQAIALIMDAVVHYDKQGKTLLDIYKDITTVYGLHETKTIAFYIELSDQKNLISQLEKVLLKMQNDPSSAKFELKMIESLNKTFQLSYPKGRILLRPSGTEPLIKVYMESYGSIGDIESLASPILKKIQDSISDNKFH